MKSFGYSVLIIVLVSVLLIAMTTASPIDDTDLLSESESDSALLDESLEPEADKSASSYDDEIVSHVVEIVNFALDAMQP